MRAEPPVRVSPQSNRPSIATLDEAREQEEAENVQRGEEQLDQETAPGNEG